MNIEDVDLGDLEGKDWMREMFKKQHELRAKYDPIEKGNGFHEKAMPEDGPLDLDDRFHQARIKDYCWRITEEMGEAIECLGGCLPAEGLPSEFHFSEEVIDALHFLVELMDLTGLSDQQGMESWLERRGMDVAYLVRNVRENTMMVVETLAKACNCLKNKPWKQTHHPTDKDRFLDLVRAAWNEFGQVLGSFGYTPREVAVYYFKKAEVNEFRQRSNY